MHTRTPSIALLALVLVLVPVAGAEERHDRGDAAPGLDRRGASVREPAGVTSFGRWSLPHEGEVHARRSLDQLPDTESRRRCEESETALCLLDNRFRVVASWFTGVGARGAVRDTQVSDSTGLLRPFAGSEVKMLVSMLDACSVRGRSGFWVFAAATADLDVALSITDTVTGRRRDYRTPGGASGPTVVDVTTFNDCR